MTLDNYTNDELTKELKRREEEEKSTYPYRPQPLSFLYQDFSKVRIACEAHIQELIDGRVDSDADHYIYENAMEAIYGKDVFDWVNLKLV